MDLGRASRFTPSPPREGVGIGVVGIGAAGGSAVTYMIEQEIHGEVRFVALDTNEQALAKNPAPWKIQPGRDLTKGLGAGARPAVGAEAIMGSRSEIEEALRGLDVVFIAAGMGGGTGTGGAPVVASVARQLGVLTVAVVTKPPNGEGSRRKRTAREGIALLKEHVDTLVVIPTERLVGIAPAQASLADVFALADEVAYGIVRAVSDLLAVHGLINLDLADVQTAMRDGGYGLVGMGAAGGGNRAERAASEAISSPLLDGLSISGARNVLVNITSGPDLGIREATRATSIIQREAGEDVEVIFGTVIDEGFGDELRVTIVATGFEDEALAERLASSEADAPGEPRPSTSRDTAGLDVYLDPGEASSEDLVALYGALSELHRACGGTGLVMRDDAQPVLVDWAGDHAL